MKRLLLLVIVVLGVALLPARGEGPDEQYVRIYNLIQQADALNTSDRPAALAKYLEALTALQAFQKMYPTWKVKVVNFRLDYLSSKVSEATGKAPSASAPPKAAATVLPAKPPTPSTPEPPAVKPSPSAELERKLATMQEEVNRLQADKNRLELKLKEAFATQPAAADPRELAKAQERIQSLLKENELLKATKPAESPAPGTDTKSIEELKAQLIEANRKLNEQSERADALALEKKALENRLQTLIPAANTAPEIEALKKARDEADRKLAEQNNLALQLAGEKKALLERVKTLSASADAAEALRAENELLKKQLAEAKSSPAKPEEFSQKLTQAEARIAALQSDAELLRLEKTALENRVKSLTTQTVPAPIAAATSRSEDLLRIKLLEDERFDLARRLDEANKELYGRKSKGTSAKVSELSQQVATLRARLEILEARPVPYTAEELALFKKPEPVLAATNPKAGKKPVGILPRGSATLVAEAQRDFAAKRFDQAEEKYLEVLRQDEKNTYTLANLARIQLELNRFDEAERNVRKALALDADDAYSLSIFGDLRFRQKRYDEALDAFSRAAKLNPQSAEIQNYLGITLSHKGLRIPAETALRKAIQLNPGYSNAHNNLAVIYATQQPPQIELARWHYQKALAAGHPHNAELEKVLNQKPSGGSAR